MASLAPTDSMSPDRSTRIKWPTSEAEWNLQKIHIRQYYLEEDRALRDVVAVMQEQHGFKARFVLCLPIVDPIQTLTQQQCQNV